MDRMDLDHDLQSSSEPPMPPRPPDNLYDAEESVTCPFVAQNLLQHLPSLANPSHPRFHEQSQNHSQNNYVDQYPYYQSYYQMGLQRQIQNQNEDRDENLFRPQAPAVTLEMQMIQQHSERQRAQLLHNQHQRQVYWQQQQFIYQQLGLNQYGQYPRQQAQSPQVSPSAQANAQNETSPEAMLGQRPAASLPPLVSPDALLSRTRYTPVYAGGWPLAESGLGAVDAQHPANTYRNLHSYRSAQHGFNHSLGGFHHSGQHSGSHPSSGAPSSGVNPRQQAQQPGTTVNITATITMSSPPAGPPPQAGQTQASASAANGPSTGGTTMSSSVSPTNSATDPATPAPLGSIASAPAPQASVQSDRGHAAVRRRLAHVRREVRNMHVPYYASSSDDSETETRPSPPRYGFPHGSADSTAAREAHARSNAAIFFQEVMNNRRGPGVTKTTLRTLDPVKIDSLDEDERMCIICYVDFGDTSPEGVVESPLRLPKCKHVFGNRCIKKWLKENRSCPYCRDKLEPDLQVRFSSARRNAFAEERLRYTDYPSAQAPRQVGSIHSSSPSQTRGESGLPSGSPSGPLSNTTSRPNHAPDAVGRSGFSGFRDLQRAEAAERTGERRGAPHSESADGPTRRVRLRVENSALRRVDSPPTPTMTDTPSSSARGPVRFNNNSSNSSSSNNGSLQPPASVSMSSSFQISSSSVQSSRPATTNTTQQPPAQSSQPSGQQQIPMMDHRTYGAFSSPMSFLRSTPQTANGSTTSANGNSNGNSTGNSSNTNTSAATINFARNTAANNVERAAISAWNRQVLPLPNTTLTTTTTSPTSLPTDASRPIITSPFDHQIPPGFNLAPGAYPPAYHTPNMPQPAMPAATASAGPSPMPTLSSNSTTLPPLGPMRHDPFIPHITDPANYGPNQW